MTGRATQTDGPACPGLSGSSLCLRRTALCLQPCGQEGPVPNSPGSLVLVKFWMRGAQAPSCCRHLSIRVFLKEFRRLVFYLPFSSGEWNKDRPRVPWGRAGERGLGVVGYGLEPGTLQGQPASPHPLSQPHSPLAQTGEWAVLVPVPMLA